ncbi:hypothetical protein KPH14_010567 [Odynerus spinipes]|uniref:Uncharacterized protein n=1 Tax=Odynerus spinipes TaxID=1348599 RepID=A0AAD9RVI6_9HYME|nr:hypothetical protein KPH14_010567 [Odynerus spinipes]
MREVLARRENFSGYMILIGLEYSAARMNFEPGNAILDPSKHGIILAPESGLLLQVTSIPTSGEYLLSFSRSLDLAMGKAKPENGNGDSSSVADTRFTKTPFKVLAKLDIRNSAIIPPIDGACAVCSGVRSYAGGYQMAVEFVPLPGEAEIGDGTPIDGDVTSLGAPRRESTTLTREKHPFVSPGWNRIQIPHLVKSNILRHSLRAETLYYTVVFLT